MLTLIFGIGVFAVSLIFRLAHKLRLTIPLLYFLAVPTVLRNWYAVHTALAAWILYALLALAALSWVVTLLRVIRDAKEDRSPSGYAPPEPTARASSARRGCGNQMPISSCTSRSLILMQPTSTDIWNTSSPI